MKLTSHQLLDAYRSMWSNRTLSDENSIDDEKCGFLLMEAIERDIRDEMTHPRVRKSPETKFHIAIKRIMASQLQDKEKLELIHLHLETLDKVINARD